MDPNPLLSLKICRRQATCGRPPSTASPRWPPIRLPPFPLHDDGRAPHHFTQSPTSLFSLLQSTTSPTPSQPQSAADKDLPDHPQLRLDPHLLSPLVNPPNRQHRLPKPNGNDDNDEGGGLLADMLNLLNDVALDPCDNHINAEKERKGRVQRARKLMFLRADDVPDLDDFPYRKKQKLRNFLSATNGDPHSLRRSQRTILKLGNSELSRHRVPIGPTFQVDIPEWTGPQI